MRCMCSGVHAWCVHVGLGGCMNAFAYAGGVMVWADADDTDGAAWYVDAYCTLLRTLHDAHVGAYHEHELTTMDDVIPF